MKIAIPTNDQESISQHFGRSKGFVVVEIENDKVSTKTYKENKVTGHAQGQHHDHDHSHDHNHGEHKHSHAGILAAIGDCDIVVAGGMGRRLYQDFADHNIQVFVTKEPNIETAIELLINNTLDNNKDKCCEH